MLLLAMCIKSWITEVGFVTVLALEVSSIVVIFASTRFLLTTVVIRIFRIEGVVHHPTCKHISLILLLSSLLLLVDVLKCTITNTLTHMRLILAPECPSYVADSIL